jgi:four helix bundle protein
MEKEELCERTKRFSIRIINLATSLPDNISGSMTAHQIIRSGSAVGANYRAACRAKSRRDFINKIKIVEEETDETLFWLEIIEELQLIKSEKITNLKKETLELLSIFVASLKTARKN